MQHNVCRPGEEEVNKPLCRAESLGAFFYDLGLVNFIVGGRKGAYGFEWGHVKLERLDGIVIRESMEKGRDGHTLEHTAQGPESTPMSLANGVKVSTSSFGTFGQPSFLARDQINYEFLSAWWENDQFYIRTLVSLSSEKTTSEVLVYTIAQLRDMIGLPSK